MIGVIYNPTPKLTLQLKCSNCGYKAKIFFGLMNNQCRNCGDSMKKLSIGINKRKKSPWIVN